MELKIEVKNKQTEDLFRGTFTGSIEGMDKDVTLVNDKDETMSVRLRVQLGKNRKYLSYCQCLIEKGAKLFSFATNWLSLSRASYVIHTGQLVNPQNSWMFAKSPWKIYLTLIKLED